MLLFPFSPDIKLMLFRTFYRFVEDFDIAFIDGMIELTLEEIEKLSCIILASVFLIMRNFSCLTFFQ